MQKRQRDTLLGIYSFLVTLVSLLSASEKNGITSSCRCKERKKNCVLYEREVNKA